MYQRFKIRTGYVLNIHNFHDQAILLQPLPHQAGWEFLTPTTAFTQRNNVPRWWKWLNIETIDMLLMFNESACASFSLPVGPHSVVLNPAQIY